MSGYSSQYITTGDIISTDSSFLRGHGTIVKNGAAVATVSGFVERVNKLVSVKSLQARYNGEVGDVVVGRITEVGDRKWKVEINHRQSSALMLSSINLPGGAQRKRTVEDQLQMRAFFEEHDLISAEVQSILSDGALSLHTRTTKYGKLQNGQFIEVPSALIKRCKQHFHSLDIGVDVILGNNGFIWIEPTKDTASPDDEGGETATKKRKEIAKTENDPSLSPSPVIRERMSRVRNAIAVLSKMFISIHVATIMDVYNDSIQLGLTAPAMLHADMLQVVSQSAAARAFE